MKCTWYGVVRGRCLISGAKAAIQWGQINSEGTIKSILFSLLFYKTLSLLRWGHMVRDCSWEEKTYHFLKQDFIDLKKMSIMTMCRASEAYRLIGNERENVHSKILLMKS